ncbi:MAG: hypothetical protein LBT66_09055 [Methanobrevibacter sp.]|jgi:hypothetical protein|nr:hypothetical protein [Candidatus Methanovirga meridionalis]
MINDKIQDLRQAAKVSSGNDSEKLWCATIGNEELINEINYSVLASKKRVKIVFREHIVIKEFLIQKKFDFTLIFGYSENIRELSYLSKDKGGAYIRIAPFYVTNEHNLMFLVGSEEIIKKFAGNATKIKANFSILLEDKTTGFIETDFNMGFLPNFLKTMISPLFNVSDLALSIVLISVNNEENIKDIEKIAKSNKIFIKSLKDIKSYFNSNKQDINKKS